MKKLFFLTLTCLISLCTIAQLKADLILSSTPPANLAEWPSHREVLTLIVTGQPGLPPQKFIVKVEIKTTDGTVIASNDLSRATQYTSAVSAGTILFAADVVPLENMVFTGKYRTSLQRSGKLPSDNYMLCVTLVRPVDYTPLSPTICKSFYLASTQLPVLMKPYNEEVLDAAAAQTAITFRWSPVSPRLTQPVTYHLQVFEVLEHQSPVQALRSNQPLLDQNIVNATQYIWRPQLSFDFKDSAFSVTPDQQHEPRIGILFIWTIQTLDVQGLPITQTDGNGEGRSEPIVFYVRKNNH